MADGNTTRSAGLPGSFSSFFSGPIPTTGSSYNPGSVIPGSIPTLGRPWSITSPAVTPINPDSNIFEETGTGETQNVSMSYTLMRYADGSHNLMTFLNGPFWTLTTDNNIPTSNRQGLSAVTSVSLAWGNGYSHAKFVDAVSLLFNSLESVAYETLGVQGNLNAGSAPKRPEFEFKLTGTKDEPSARLTRKGMNSNEEYFKYRGPNTMRAITKQVVDLASGAHPKELSTLAYALWERMRLRFGSEDELYNATNPDAYNQRNQILAGRALPVAGFAEDVDGERGFLHGNAEVKNIPILVSWNVMGPRGDAQRSVLGKGPLKQDDVQKILNSGAIPGIANLNQTLDSRQYESLGLYKRHSAGAKFSTLVEDVNQLNELFDRAINEIVIFIRKSFSATDVQASTGATGSPIPFLIGAAARDKIRYGGCVTTLQENAEGRSIGGSPFSSIPTANVIKYRLAPMRNQWGSVLRTGKMCGFLLTRRFVGRLNPSGHLERTPTGSAHPEGVCWQKHLLYKEMVEQTVTYNLGTLRPTVSDYNPLHTVLSLHDNYNANRPFSSGPQKSAGGGISFGSGGVQKNDYLNSLIDHNRSKTNSFWNETPRITKSVWDKLSDEEKHDATFKFYDYFVRYPCVNDDTEALNEHYGYPDIFGRWQAPVFIPIGYPQFDYLQPNYPYGKLVNAMGLTTEMGREPSTRFTVAKDFGDLPLVEMMILS